MLLILRCAQVCWSGSPSFVIFLSPLSTSDLFLILISQSARGGSKTSQTPPQKSSNPSLFRSRFNRKMTSVFGFMMIGMPCLRRGQTFSFEGRTQKNGRVKGSLWNSSTWWNVLTSSKKAILSRLYPVGFISLASCSGCYGTKSLGWPKALHLTE